jgi:radical SAM protein with 4Fe4S-binding SPASM domain
MSQNDSIQPVNFPSRAVISVNDKCNSRCSFCKIWETENPLDLELALIEKLPASLKNIDITGGEPLLNKNIEEIFNQFLTKGCQVIVITNGLVNLSKFEKLWEVPNLGVRLSLDGIGERHDSLRGIPGNYQKVIQQIQYLKTTRCQDIGISSTFSETNIDQIDPLHSLSEQLNVQFGIMVVGNSQAYYHKSDNIIQDARKLSTEIGNLIRKELRTFKIKKWGRSIYMSELIEFINGNIKALKCPAGETFFFMKPNGDIYLCNMRDILLGNLAEQSFEEIWFSERAHHARRIAQNCTVPCWTMCNAKSIIFENKLKYLRRFCLKLPGYMMGRYNKVEN